jgi:hypothetical protein
MSSQVPGPAQALVTAQFRVVSDDTHVNMQLVSQPMPVPFFDPRSHSSPGSRTPSPHTPAAHVALWQKRPIPHDAPSASGVPFAHVWGVALLVAPAHFSVPLQGLWSSQSASPFKVSAIQNQVQSFLLQPVTVAGPASGPGSHSSPGSTIPLPHEDDASWAASNPPSAL